MIKAAQAYFATQVTTTSQSDLLLMLYEGAIKFLNQAKVKIDEKNFAQKGILISKAMDIIGELDSSLNSDKGGEVAKNLHQLYFYCNARLLRANMDMNNTLVDEVIRILTSLREAFEIIKDDAPQVAPPTGSAPQVRHMAAAGTQQGPPKASAAHASRAYGGGQQAPTQETNESDEMPVEPASSQTSTQTLQAPEAPGARRSTTPPPGAPVLVRPAESSPQPKPGPSLLRKPGLPGAYGRQDPTR
ncbi:MAG: flagellar export chaperone FliS [Proteobacteria bacterium]|nr:flagellar export chaperone FliS [Pseudomonadota bacterium]